jgi:hypothetical protein
VKSFIKPISMVIAICVTLCLFGFTSPIGISSIGQSSETIIISHNQEKEPAVGESSMPMEQPKAPVKDTIGKSSAVAIKNPIGMSSKPKIDVFIGKSSVTYYNKDGSVNRVVDRDKVDTKLAPKNNVIEKNVKTIEKPTEKQIGKYKMITNTLAATVINGTYRARDLPIGTVIKEPTTGEEFVLIANGDIEGTKNHPATWLSLSPPYATSYIESDDPGVPFNTLENINNKMLTQYNNYSSDFKQMFNAIKFIDNNSVGDFLRIGYEEVWDINAEEYVMSAVIDQNRKLQLIGKLERFGTSKTGYTYSLTKGYLYEHLINDKISVGWGGEGDSAEFYGKMLREYYANYQTILIDLGIFAHNSDWAPLAYAVTCPLDTLITLDYGTVHTHEYELKNDATHHWYQCKTCGDIKDKAPHYDNNNDNRCDVCGHIMDSVPPTISALTVPTGWAKSKTITFNATDSSGGIQYRITDSAGTELQAWTSSASWTVAELGSFNLYARDKWGNTTAAYSFSVTGIDNLPPLAPTINI